MLKVAHGARKIRRPLIIYIYIFIYPPVHVPVHLLRARTVVSRLPAANRDNVGGGSMLILRAVLLPFTTTSTPDRRAPAKFVCVCECVSCAVCCA